MKKIFKILLVFLVFVGIISCDNDLTEELNGSLSESNLKSEGDAAALVDGVYAGLSKDGYSYYTYGHLAYITDGITDVFKLAHGVGSREANLERYQWQDDNIASAQWGDMFSVVSRANWALKLIKATDDAVYEDANTKSRLLGEASFLRALAYYDLVGAFGGVPLLIKPVESDIPGLPRSSASEIFSQIESDLQFAISTLPDVHTPGKATAGAAYSLLAKTQLRQGKWAEANNNLDQVIGLGTYDLYTEGSFLELFYESRALDNEYIFAVLSLGESYDVASNHHIKAFTPWAYDTGWNSCGIPETLYNTIEPGDERLEVYFDNYTPYWGGSASAVAQWGIAINRKFSHYNRDVTAPGTGYSAYNNYGISKLNVPVIRYADILLLKADVENELNGPNNIAYDAINAVRNRAGLANLQTGLNKLEFRDAVLKERALELATEGHRKDDLIRHGIFESTMTQYLMDQGYPEGTAVTEDHQLLPIPRTELDLNPNLEPNPSNSF